MEQFLRGCIPRKKKVATPNMNQGSFTVERSLSEAIYASRRARRQRDNKRGFPHHLRRRRRGLGDPL